MPQDHRSNSSRFRAFASGIWKPFRHSATRSEKWAGNFSATWGNERLTFGYQARYMGNQFLRLVEVNEAASFDNGTSGVLWIHNLSGNYVISDKFTVYGGIQNLADEQPFATQPAFPTGLRGRYFFAGVTATL